MELDGPIELTKTLRLASEHLKRVAVPTGVAPRPEPRGGDDPGPDDNSVSLEMVLETLVWRYGGTPQPEWHGSMHTRLSFIVLPMCMPVTRLIFGQWAFGTTSADQTVYSMLFLLLGYMTHFSVGKRLTPRHISSMSCRGL
jgi:hypothetical protein